jgi:hypothetical protein
VVVFEMVERFEEMLKMVEVVGEEEWEDERGVERREERDEVNVNVEADVDAVVDAAVDVDVVEVEEEEGVGGWIGKPPNLGRPIPRWWSIPIACVEGMWTMAMSSRFVRNGLLRKKVIVRVVDPTRV